MNKVTVNTEKWWTQESYSIASFMDSLDVISRESIRLDSFIRTIGYFNVSKWKEDGCVAKRRLSAVESADKSEEYVCKTCSWVRANLERPIPSALLPIWCDWGDLISCGVPFLRPFDSLGAFHACFIWDVFFSEGISNIILTPISLSCSSFNIFLSLVCFGGSTVAWSLSRVSRTSFINRFDLVFCFEIVSFTFDRLGVSSKFFSLDFPSSTFFLVTWGVIKHDSSDGPDTSGEYPSLLSSVIFLFLDGVTSLGFGLGVFDLVDLPEGLSFIRLNSISLSESDEVVVFGIGFPFDLSYLGWTLRNISRIQI